MRFVNKVKVEGELHRWKSSFKNKTNIENVLQREAGRGDQGGIEILCLRLQECD